MAIFSDEVFSQNFDLLENAILRNQSSMSQPKIIRFKVGLNESREHAANHDTISQNYQGVPVAPNRVDASYMTNITGSWSDYEVRKS